MCCGDLTILKFNIDLCGWGCGQFLVGLFERSVRTGGHNYQHQGGVFPLAVAGLEFFEISKISFGARGRFWSVLTASTFVALALLHRFNDSIGCDDTLGTHALPLVCLFVCLFVC